MRVFFPLVALVAGAHALSSSLYQKRGGLDTCSNIGSSVTINNPVSGKPINFGNIGEIIPVLSHPTVALNAFFASFGRHLCVPFGDT